MVDDVKIYITLDIRNGLERFAIETAKDHRTDPAEYITRASPLVRDFEAVILHEFSETNEGRERWGIDS